METPQSKDDAVAQSGLNEGLGLLPCPFCGGGKTEFREQAIWRGQGYGVPYSVSVMHWCEKIEGQPSRGIERIGRDKASAIAMWNMRAPNVELTGSPKASPS